MTATIVPFKLCKDAFGTPTLIRNMPQWTDSIVLAANTNQTYTPPAGTDLIVLSATSAFYAKIGGTATVPSGATSNGAASELSPSAYTFAAGPGATSIPTIGLISAGTPTITISCYKLSPGN